MVCVVARCMTGNVDEVMTLNGQIERIEAALEGRVNDCGRLYEYYARNLDDTENRKFLQVELRQVRELYILAKSELEKKLVSDALTSPSSAGLDPPWRKSEEKRPFWDNWFGGDVAELRIHNVSPRNFIMCVVSPKQIKSAKINTSKLAAYAGLPPPVAKLLALNFEYASDESTETKEITERTRQLIKRNTDQSVKIPRYEQVYLTTYFCVADDIFEHKKVALGSVTSAFYFSKKHSGHSKLNKLNKSSTPPELISDDESHPL